MVVLYDVSWCGAWCDVWCGVEWSAVLCGGVLGVSLALLCYATAKLLAPEALVVLSTYAVGYSPLAFANLFEELGAGSMEVGELALRESGGERLLPAGFCARWRRGFES